jgi:ribosomal protein L19
VVVSYNGLVLKKQRRGWNDNFQILKVHMSYNFAQK